jgi:Tfp pilus assembly protein PilW
MRARAVVASLLRRADLRAEGGWSLMEMLIAVLVSSFVLGTATALMSSLVNVNVKSERQLEAQDKARTAVDSLAIQLRNAIGPSGSQPIYAPAAGSTNPTTELVFWSPKPSASTTNNPRGLQWIRYCLDYSNAANETLWKQTAAYDTTQAVPPSTTTCPSASWTSRVKVATNVVNRASTGTDCKDTATNSYDPFKPTVDTGGTIRDMRLCLLVQGEPTRKATMITSSVDFRNSKSAPNATISCRAQNGHAVCDASGSTDPDGEALAFKWKYLCCSPSFSGGDTDWEAGQTSYLFDKGGLVSGSIYRLYVQVTSASGLSSTVFQNVTMP